MKLQNEHTNCLICKSNQLLTLKKYQESFLVKCEGCNFVFSEKIPTTAELIDHYNQYSRADYLSPITIKRFHELLDKFEPYRKTGKILDVGCGIGYFLEVAKERGWEVFGTEFTDEAITICSKKGIQMHQGKLDSSNYEAESFDIITSFEVIEHINNPIEELEQTLPILRKGGLYYLTTPNFNSLLRYKLKEKYNVICYPEHLSYYTPKTIKKLFKSKGFKTKKIETTGISLSRLRASTSKESFTPISETSDDELLRNKFEKNGIAKFTKISINKMLTIFGVGDSLKAWFIKK